MIYGSEVQTLNDWGTTLYNEIQRYKQLNKIFKSASCDEVS